MRAPQAMAGDGTSVERLRQYLRELKPAARSILIGELERSLLHGEEASGVSPVLGASLVLQELRQVVREQREGVPRIGGPARMFFKPLEPFIVDDIAEHKHPGRVARGLLEQLWTWIRRDLLPEETKAFTDAVNEALLAGNTAKAERLTRAFQDRAAGAIEAAFAAASDDERIRRRLLVQIGTPRATDDAAILMRALKSRDALATFAAHLPLHIVNLADQRLDEAKVLIESTAAFDRETFIPALLIVLSRLGAPWQLLRLGVKAAGTDVAARVAETAYGVTVTIVLAELERLVGELQIDLRSGRGVAVGALLKTIHDAARGLRTELELPVDSTWGRALAAQRARISELLRSEIESAPARVRRLLRPRPSTEIRANSVLDADEVAETAALVEFVGNCRHFAGELALNEITLRTLNDLQQFLDSGTRALLDGLRHAGAADRSFRQSQVDAAARFCGKVYGADYAAMLAKAAAVAAAPERRFAHA
ncbi:MAG TPA: hypothetical protein VMI47_00020 [Pseudolabrys sp.]|nr:hypothetical protein [Pseudolabrys sp.]